MKQYIFTLAIAILFSSCDCTNMAEKNEEDSNSVFQINPCLIEPIRKYISIVETDFVRRDKDSSVIYIIDFWNEYPNNARPFDTIIVFDYYIKRESIKGYKGCAHIDNYHIAVFDESEIGHKYYNEDKLVKIPFKCFKPFIDEEYNQKWECESVVQLLAEKDGLISPI